MANRPRPENPARTVRIEDSLWTQVKTLAARQRTSASEVVREAIRQHVGRKELGDE